MFLDGMLRRVLSLSGVLELSQLKMGRRKSGFQLSFFWLREERTGVAFLSSFFFLNWCLLI